MTMNKRFFAFLAAGGVFVAMTLGAAQAAEKDTMMKDKPAADMKAKPMADDKMKTKPMADDKMKAKPMADDKMKGQK
jgi:hypothetical protein